jgi:hypothetical protein
MHEVSCFAPSLKCNHEACMEASWLPRTSALVAWMSAALKSRSRRRLAFSAGCGFHCHMKVTLTCDGCCVLPPCRS